MAHRERCLGTGKTNEVTFENMANDWPKRIHYEKTKKRLAARLEGAAGQPVEEWTYESMVIERAH